MKAWVFQDPKQVKKHGTACASWYVGWFDTAGKKRSESCGSGPVGKHLADKLRKKREAELITGTYDDKSKKTWAEFRTDYETKILSGKTAGTRRVTLDAFAAFERIIRPVRMLAIKTQTIDDFRAKRRQERGKKKGELLSPATVNKDLRHLRAALKKAKKWDYLKEMPDFEFEREPEKLVIYVTPEHFAALYEACGKAKAPAGLPYPAADWWRGLIVLAYMTGWRISEMLAVRRADVDLDAGTAITRYEDNKGKREEQVRLHPVVVEHLRMLPGFDPCVFPWDQNERALYEEFAAIQEAAGIKLPCRREHGHTRYCHVYGFHDLRRAFATVNAKKLTADTLQKLMRHKSYLTTKKYINMTDQLAEAVAVLHVPDVLRQRQV
jgi:integrase